MGHLTTPFVTIYDWNTGSPVKIANPATLPTNGCYSAAWSPDGRYLAVGHGTTPFVTIYDWQSGSPVKIADPATLPGNAGFAAGWSLDGRYLAIGCAGTPFVTIYDWNTGSPVKIANPATLPPEAGTGIAWSPDGRYLAVSNQITSPYITIYDWNTGSPVKIANPATLPTGNGVSAAWSPDGRYLAVGHNTTPFVTIYLIKETWVRLSLISTGLRFSFYNANDMTAPNNTDVAIAAGVWRHVSVNNDKANTRVYYTLDDSEQNYSYAGQTLVATACALTISFPATAYQLFLDDLLLLADVYLERITASRAHFATYGQPWVDATSGIDALTDLVIAAKGAGKIKLLSPTDYYAPVSSEPSLGTPHKHFATIASAVPGSDAVQVTSLIGIVPAGSTWIDGWMEITITAAGLVNLLDTDGVGIMGRGRPQVVGAPADFVVSAPLDSSLNLRWQTTNYANISALAIYMNRYFD